MGTRSRSSLTASFTAHEEPARTGTSQFIEFEHRLCWYEDAGTYRTGNNAATRFNDATSKSISRNDWYSIACSASSTTTRAVDKHDNDVYDTSPTAQRPTHISRAYKRSRPSSSMNERLDKHGYSYNAVSTMAILACRTTVLVMLV